MEYALSRRDLINPNKLFAMGTSMGGATVSQMAMNNGQHLRGVIIENAFTDLRELINETKPLFASISPFAMRMHYPTARYVEKINLPILFMCGHRDTMVPFHHTYKLMESAKYS
mmetsp:Transcript_8466/g.14218  ORF Transcript_8466/g.14218 Transcript_8466/m.14218 type:complete len:114 (+) Transcript_8466:535-876(+)